MRHHNRQSIKPPRSVDWIVGDQIVGKITLPEHSHTGDWIALVDISEPRLGLYGSVVGVGPSRAQAETDCLRHLSMCGYDVSRRYTTIVNGRKL